VLLHRSAAITVEVSLDGQGRLATVSAVVRQRCQVRVSSGAEVVFDVTLEPGEYSRNVPVPRRLVWSSEDPQFSLAVSPL
jgi:hypothetical protein